MDWPAIALYVTVILALTESYNNIQILSFSVLLTAITFAQLFKAYSAFNNDGLAMSPRLVDYLEDNGYFNR